MIDGRQITVVGGGIGGLAASVALARRGARVTVLEQAPALREVGAGIQISPNGTRVLDALGLGAKLRAAGPVSRAVELRDYRRGARVLRLDLARIPDRYSAGAHPFILIHRARMIALLAEAARGAGVDIRTGHRVRPADPPLPGEALRIGAEGLHSPLRGVLNGPSAPFFTGQAAWRAVIPGDAAPEAHVYMGPGRHLVTYPLGDGLRNIVAVEERGSWTAEGWSHPDDPGRMRRAFAGFAPEIRGWLDQVAEVHVWGLFRHEVARIWHGDNCALLGDAAHPTLPFMAQGANLALEDAWVLADCLDAHPLPEALARYQARRRPRAVRMIAAANANARNYHLRGAIMRGAAHAALRLGGRVFPAAPLRRFGWIYDHDVTAG